MFGYRSNVTPFCLSFSIAEPMSLASHPNTVFCAGVDPCVFADAKHHAVHIEHQRKTIVPQKTQTELVPIKRTGLVRLLRHQECHNLIHRTLRDCLSYPIAHLPKIDRLPRPSHYVPPFPQNATTILLTPPGARDLK